MVADDEVGAEEEIELAGPDLARFRLEIDRAEDQVQVLAPVVDPGDVGVFERVLDGERVEPEQVEHHPLDPGVARPLQILDVDPGQPLGVADRLGQAVARPVEMDRPGRVAEDDPDRRLGHRDRRRLRRWPRGGPPPGAFLAARPTPGASLPLRGLVDQVDRQVGFGAGGDRPPDGPFHRPELPGRDRAERGRDAEDRQLLQTHDHPTDRHTIHPKPPVRADRRHPELAPRPLRRRDLHEPATDRSVADPDDSADLGRGKPLRSHLLRATEHGDDRKPAKPADRPPGAHPTRHGRPRVGRSWARSRRPRTRSAPSGAPPNVNPAQNPPDRPRPTDGSRSRPGA